MNRHLCIHGHLYQPPRENPWLEEVELEDDAFPYHDWNEKITAECYRRNAASRILRPDKRIIDIVNNFTHISFDVGPTLLLWLQRHAPDVYDSILQADKESLRRFPGHGAAMAQAYNHVIMPLANSRDKRTETLWGIRDFEFRFGRPPEGMWLPETAVDIETLEIYAEHQILFTVLAPHQAGRIRRIGDSAWRDIRPEDLDTTQPYLCTLPSGRAISLFFYNVAAAGEVISGRILQSGELFARRLCDIFHPGDRSQLAHIATDGETYGHHFHFTDMALAYCLHYIQTNNLATLTVYGQYLSQFPPRYEVEIKENTSWSCPHGVERWRSNCGCHYGRHPAGKQQWRQPLRQAMDWLRDRLIPLYEQKMGELAPSPWKRRDDYIQVINNRSSENIQRFISAATDGELAYDRKVQFLKLLEMQRHALLMYTSCGWFFDDIAGIEAIQVLEYAARAIQLAKECGGDNLEPGFKEILEQAPANAFGIRNGREAYDGLVKPSNVDLNRVGAHVAVSSLFREYPEEIDVFCYTAKIDDYRRTRGGIQSLILGRATIKSKIVLETHPVDFAVFHFGDHNLIGAVTARLADEAFEAAYKRLRQAFSKGDTTEIVRLMNLAFNGNSYSVVHLFKDQQRRILNRLLKPAWEEIEASFRQTYQHHYAVMQMMRGMGIPLPKVLAVPVEYLLNEDLRRVIGHRDANLRRIRDLADQMKQFGLQPDQSVLSFEAGQRIARLMSELKGSPENTRLLAEVEQTCAALLAITKDVDLQSAQNILFSISKTTYPMMTRKAQSGDAAAQTWLAHFCDLAQCVGIEVR